MILLTILTQVGGLVWLLATCFKHKLLAFLLLYSAVTLTLPVATPYFGRVALTCQQSGPLQMQSRVYCVLNRHYVTPELATVLTDTANHMSRRYPGTVTLVLDANFPFMNGFPLLPHLSHNDGRRADLAFYYRNATVYQPNATRSPIGYFAFEPGPTHCPPVWPTLRWNLTLLQPLWRTFSLEQQRKRALLTHLAKDDRIGKIFIEPHLVRTLNVSHPKIRIQGCRAARYDDHIHIQQ
ncbi:hypothetical protein [Shimia abyssi]|uniref:hypothetical protein n=1 Tax=Shimia abyssi TaxID=1662395 RepID=UPI001FAE81E8|nr:hypothetical protein [Shimia abyssi]